MSFYQLIKDRIQGKAPKGARRSSQWKKFRREWISKHPSCSVCGGKKKVEVHHIVPFHVAPHLELEPKNLLNLCEAKKYGINCHLLIGHRGNYQRINEPAFRDAVYLSCLIRRR